MPSSRLPSIRCAEIRSVARQVNGKRETQRILLLCVTGGGACSGSAKRIATIAPERPSTCGGRAVGAGLLRITFASLGMGAILWAVTEGLVPYRMVWGLPLRVGWVAAVASLGAFAFVAFAKLLGAPEVDEVLGAFRKKGVAR